MRRLQIVIDVELDEEATITPAVLRRAYGCASNYHELVMDPEFLQDTAHEETLLNVLRSQPAAYQEYVKANVLSHVESLTTSYTKLLALAGLHRQDYEVVEDVIAQLPGPGLLQPGRQGGLAIGKHEFVGPVL